MTRIAISHTDDSLRAHARTLTLPRELSLLLLVVWFGFLELRGLYFPDEGRYAEIPREMFASGDWVTPRLNGFPYFEKPPLQYWVTAGIFTVAGEDEWTARLGPAIAGFLAVFAVCGTAGRLYSRRSGQPTSAWINAHSASVPLGDHHRSWLIESAKLGSTFSSDVDCRLESASLPAGREATVTAARRSLSTTPRQASSGWGCESGSSPS